MKIPPKLTNTELSTLSLYFYFILVHKIISVGLNFPQKSIFFMLFLFTSRFSLVSINYSTVIKCSKN